MRVYHGSSCQVERPLVTVCRDNLDFGKGFYVTDMKDQAIRWAKRFAVAGEKAFLNIYDFDMNAVSQVYRTCLFTSYNDEWLDFVIASRHGERPWEKFDLVVGGIANDRVFNTIELYFGGMIQKEEALRRLRFEQPNNQLCLLSQPLVDQHLQFSKALPLIQNGGDYVCGE